jgi:glycosyltransferase involved in cell wall biosynthesis
MRLLVFNLATDADDPVLGFTTDWVNAMADRCERVVVITMRAGRLAVRPNVIVHSVGKEKDWGRVRRTFEFYKVLRRVLATERLEACFSHMIHVFPILAWPLLRLRRVPIVLWYAHGHVPPLLRLATLLVDRVVTSSASGFRVATPKRLIIGQGIDTHRFAAPVSERSEEFVLLSVGRISRVKHLDAALELLGALPEHAPDGRRFRLRVIGSPLTRDDEQYASELKALAGRLGVSSRVTFQSATSFDAVSSVYPQADLFISHSQTGSMDKAVLEAMSCGVPVLTSNPAYRAALPTVLREDLVVDDNGAATWRARTLAVAARTGAERATMGTRGREFVKSEHSLDALATKVVGILNAELQ